MTVADQPAPLFIPETEGEGLQAGEQRDGFDGLEQWLRLMAFFEVIIGNSRAEMMDVVKADVAREPLQYLRQFVERTALQRRSRVVPFIAAFPVHSLELMLDIEQPEAD